METDLSDLLVPLWGLPLVTEIPGVWIGKPLPHQSPAVISHVAGEYGAGWEAEVRTAFTTVPPKIFIAADQDTGSLIGFCCWDCTALGFLGPIGVSTEHKGRGIGKALVQSTLHSMAEHGYAYAIIGDAGPVEFFQQCCDARIIAESDPGIYGNPFGKG